MMSSTTTSPASRGRCSCDGCGEGPRTTAKGAAGVSASSSATDDDCNNGVVAVVPLKRCTRCQNAFYHDAVCQRRHWPVHRKDCDRDHRRLLLSRGRVQNSQDNTNDNGNGARNNDAKDEETKMKLSRRQRSDGEAGTSGPRFRVEERSGRGKCLFATQPIFPGEAITSSASDERAGDAGGRRSFFEPMTLPVLNERFRRHRCACCFGRLRHGGEEGIELSSLEAYPVYVCSDKCQRAASSAGDRAGGLECEMNALKCLYDNSPHGGPPKVLPSALLVYRVLVSVAAGVLSWEDEVEGMVGGGAGASNSQLDQNRDGDDDDELHHQQAVVMTVLALIACTTSSSFRGLRDCCDSRGTVYVSRLRSFQPSDVVRVLTKTKLNAFSICEDGSGVADASSSVLGLALFRSPAYRINHSCRPNSVQTFDFSGQKNGGPPKLRIAACRLIQRGEEICVSYVDTDRSRQQRRDELLKNYKFLCTCSKCTEDGEGG